MDLMGRLLRTSPHVVLFYRNLKNFAVSMYEQALRNSAAPLPPAIFGQTYSFEEHLSLVNFKDERTGLGNRAKFLMQQIRDYARLYKVTIIDYQGAKERDDDITDVLLKAADLPQLDIAQNPARAGPMTMSSSNGDETLRQLLPHIIDYARRNRSMELVSSSLWSLDFNALKIAQYERPTRGLDLSDLERQAHSFDKQLRQEFGGLFYEECADEDGTRVAINAEPKRFTDLDHAAIKEHLQEWEPRFDEFLDDLPKEFELRPLAAPRDSTTRYDIPHTDEETARLLRAFGLSPSSSPRIAFVPWPDPLPQG